MVDLAAPTLHVRVFQPADDGLHDLDVSPRGDDDDAVGALVHGDADVPARRRLQLRGEEAGPPSDLYALGVLFYEMLTGQLPFRSNDRDTLLEMQRSAPPPKPSAIKPDVLPQAEAIVLKLLEKERRKRYQDAHHLHEELKALQRSLPSTPWEVQADPANAAPPPPPPPQSPGVIEWANRAALFSRMETTLNRAREVQNDPELSKALTSDLKRYDAVAAERSARMEAELTPDAPCIRDPAVRDALMTMPTL